MSQVSPSAEVVTSEKTTPVDGKTRSGSLDRRIAQLGFVAALLILVGCFAVLAGVGR